jgi:hypothetical protein
MRQRNLAIALVTLMSVGLGVLPASATPTYTQQFNNNSDTRIISATSADSWTSVPTGFASGVSTRMNFEPTPGEQTVRLSLSLATPSVPGVDLDIYECGFSTAGARETQHPDGTKVTTVSVSTDKKTLVCDVTLGAGRTFLLFALYDSVDQTNNTQFGLIAVGRGSDASSNQSANTPAPARYSGPEFSGLSGMGIMTGNTGKLEGKRLNEISAIEIGGKAAPFTVTSTTELELSLPEGLTPGLYDLVINSSAGKLTHINAIQVRAPRQSFSVTTRSNLRISNDHYLEHSLIAAMQIPELNKARCVVNANSIAMARAMANRLCAVVKASNPNIETTIVEPRSTVKGDAVFARVTYGWN